MNKLVYGIAGRIKVNAMLVLPQVYIKKPPVDAKAAGFDGETS